MQRAKWLGLVLAFSLVSLIATGVLAKSEPVQSRWLQGQVAVDGSRSEWGDGPFGTEKDVRVNYGFQNNGQSMYVLFVFNDPQYLSSINRTGITLWFNAEGKKKKDLGIRFQKALVTAENLILLLEKQGGAVADETKQKLRQKPTYLINRDTLIKGKEDAFLPLKGDESIPDFNFQRAGATFVYEFRVPLALIGLEPGKSVNVGFEWGGLPKKGKADNFISGLVGGGEAVQARDNVLGSSSPVREEATADESGVAGMGDYGGSYIPGGDRSRIRRGPTQYSFWNEIVLAAPVK